MPNPFGSGVVIFFRCLDSTNNSLARSVHPDGRSVELRHFGHPEDYVILDEEDEILGIYPRDWVACILPLKTTGPSDAANKPS